MKDVNANNFGLVIAYLVPGFIALWGISFYSQTVFQWLAASPDSLPTVSGFLFGTLSAFGAGLVINALRWHIVDPLHYASGVPRKNWDYSRLPTQIEPFQYLVTNQFRYYECYANSMVAIAFTFAAFTASATTVSPPLIAAFVVVQLVLWSASRRTLLNYHQRIGAFLKAAGTDAQVAAPSRIDPSESNWYIQRLAVRHHRMLIPFPLRRRTIARTGIHSNNS